MLVRSTNGLKSSNNVKFNVLESLPLKYIDHVQLLNGSLLQREERVPVILELRAFYVSPFLELLAECSDVVSRERNVKSAEAVWIIFWKTFNLP